MFHVKHQELADKMFHVKHWEIVY